MRVDQFGFKSQSQGQSRRPFKWLFFVSTLYNCIGGASVKGSFYILRISAVRSTMTNLKSFNPRCRKWDYCTYSLGFFLLCIWFAWSYLYSVSSLFPGSLRYLVQQHLDLLHALQERVLKWPRQGVLGDLFLKLTNDEVRFFCFFVFLNPWEPWVICIFVSLIYFS